MNIQVNEIFYSIQGESVHTGLPCVFVRLSGCNLRCRYCDTAYAYHEGKAMSPAQILSQVARFGCNLAEITGGEPLIQDGTPALIAGLLDAGYRVLVETNGSVDIDRADRRCSRIMDIKCPSSGEADHNDAANLGRLTANDQVKFVIGDHLDFLFAKKMTSRLPVYIPPERILFSAVADRLSPRRLAGWILEARLPVRLQLQLHKVIWPHRNRGV
jgi:7-carboxy-7-deazaguanine synthase